MTLSESQTAAASAFVAAFLAHRKCQASLESARAALVAEGVRLRRLRVPNLHVARLLAVELGMQPGPLALRSLRALLRTRVSRAAARARSAPDQRSGPSENTPGKSG